MKWFRNKEMLQDILERNKKELEKYKNDKIVALLKDESNLIQDHLILLDENEKLKKALEKACKILSWDCPCGQDLIDDLDCENRCQPDIDYSECWMKYFIKEVLGND